VRIDTKETLQTSTLLCVDLQSYECSVVNDICIVIVNHQCKYFVCLTMVCTICQSAQLAKGTARFQNQGCGICTFL